MRYQKITFVSILITAVLIAVFFHYSGFITQNKSVNYVNQQSSKSNKTSFEFQNASNIANVCLSELSSNVKDICTSY